MGIYDVALLVIPLYMKTNEEQKENGDQDGVVTMNATLSSFYFILSVYL